MRRGYYCASPVLARQDDGSYARDPGRAAGLLRLRPGPVLAKLAELPEGHLRLAAEASPAPLKQQPACPLRPVAAAA